MTVSKQAIKVFENESILSAETNANYEVVVAGERGKVAMVSAYGRGRILGAMTLDDDHDATSVIFSKTQPNTVYCACGPDLYTLDCRKFTEYSSRTVGETSDGDINQIVMGDNGNYVATADDTGQVKIITLSDMKVDKVLQKHKSVCYTIQMRPDTSELVSGGYDCCVLNWDVRWGRKLRCFNMNTLVSSNGIHRGGSFVNPPYVLSLAFSSDLTALVAGLQDGSLQFWDARGARLKPADGYLDAHSSLGVTKIYFTPTYNGLMYTGGNDGLVKVWDAHILSGFEFIRQINHQVKINWITALFGPRNKLVVCDTTPHLTVYDIPI